MAKIIFLRHSDIEKVRKMIEYVSPGLSRDKFNEDAFVQFPLNFFHGLLPVSMKFLQECYVAVEGNEVLGLISLISDGNKKTRWKINRLVLNPNAYDAGKQLIDYVVNKYGGAGVETFVTTIDENYTEAIALFKQACSFRSWSKINMWGNDNLRDMKNINPAVSLRNAEIIDAKKLHELDTEALYPKFKTSFVRTEKDFKFGLKNKISNSLKNYKISRFVLDNQQKDSIESFLSIMTTDNINFSVDIILSLAYQEYFSDILSFGLNYIRSINPDAKIYMGIRDYYQTYGKMTEIVSHFGFRQCGNYNVLIKDYWRPAEYSSEKKVPIIIFPDRTSPACNVINFMK